MLWFLTSNRPYICAMDILAKGDEYYMRQALLEAQYAFDADEVPVGAVVVCQDKIIARAHNLTERLHDVTAHAEMQAITAAANYIGGKYLDQCTLYVSLEPCAMCAAALGWSQLGKLVFGAYDERKGYTTIAGKLLHPKTEAKGGILGEEAAKLLKTFFQQKR